MKFPLATLPFAILGASALVQAMPIPTAGTSSAFALSIYSRTVGSDHVKPQSAPKPSNHVTTRPRIRVSEVPTYVDSVAHIAALHMKVDRLEEESKRKIAESQEALKMAENLQLSMHNMDHPNNKVFHDLGDAIWNAKEEEEADAARKKLEEAKTEREEAIKQAYLRSALALKAAGEATGKADRIKGNLINVGNPHPDRS